MGPSPTGGRTGDLTSAQLASMLLQPDDLPGLSRRRQYASADLSTQTTPQLALCGPVEAGAPHEVANVLAQSGTIGQANVFEVLSAYADAPGAQAAYDQAANAARSCATYQANGMAFSVQELAPLALPGGAEGLHYRLATPSVVAGDVRTLVRSGRFLVLVTGYGMAPDGASLLQFQADVAAKALARLR